MDHDDFDSEFPMIDSSNYGTGADYTNNEEEPEPPEEQRVDVNEIEERVVWHPKTTEAEKTDKNLRPKSNDPTWKYSLLLKKGAPNSVKCLLCHWISTGGIGRMKGHFLANDPNCISCPNVTSFVRQEVRHYVHEKNKRASKGKGKIDDIYEPDVVFVKENSADPKKAKRPAVTVKKTIASSSGSINTKVKTLSLNSGESLKDVIKNRKKQPLIVDKLKKDERLVVDKLMAKAFYSCGIPFNVRNNIDFQVFLNFYF